MSAAPGARSHAGPASRPIVGVGVIVLRERQLLLGLRCGAHGAGTWALPGGHLEFGESVHDCAARELREETGLVIAHSSPGPYVSDLFADAGRHYVTLFVVAQVDPGAQARVMEPGKCAAWAWHAWSALPSPLFAPLDTLRRSGYSP